MPAVRASAMSPTCRSYLQKRGPACRTSFRTRTVFDFIEITASWTDQDILWVTPVLREEVARKQVEACVAGFAIEYLDP